jgi:hypothetical protein
MRSVPRCISYQTQFAFAYTKVIYERGIDNCSIAWSKGLRVHWTTIFRKKFYLFQLEKKTNFYKKCSQSTDNDFGKNYENNLLQF